MKANEAQKKEYKNYVKQVTPTHNLWYEMLKAFLTGGIICLIGQFILNTIRKKQLFERSVIYE